MVWTTSIAIGLDCTCRVGGKRSLTFSVCFLCVCHPFWNSQTYTDSNAIKLPRFGRQPSCCSSAHNPHILILSFFPHLISAVADWMSTILPHMVHTVPQRTTPKENAALFHFLFPVTLTFDLDIRTQARFLYNAPNRQVSASYF